MVARFSTAGAAPRDAVVGGELVRVDAPVEDAVQPLPQKFRLTVRWQDPEPLVIDKTAGLVSTRGRQSDRTLQTLLARERSCAAATRWHRASLDKDTSACCQARTELARMHRTTAAAERAIHRGSAICVGMMTAGGTVDAPIERHPVDRLRMSVRADGRPAVTHYRVIERFRGHTWLRVMLETGRTHQIRLHLSHAGYPLVGDPVYGRRLRLPPGATLRLQATLRGFRRQALHAAKLVFPHPQDGRQVEVESPLPGDFAELLDALREDAAMAGAVR